MFTVEGEECCRVGYDAV